jgi:proteasome accessory factor C
VSGRTSANDRFRRVLAIVPWIAERDGPTIAEICERFGLTRAQLLADLDVVLLVGLHPFTPDEYVDVIVEDDRVWIHLLPGSFARPLRLTPEQGVALVAAGSTLLNLPGVEPDGPLARGLAKLQSLLGLEGDEALAISVGPAPGQALALLQQAVRDRRQVELDYYTYGSDERKVRTVDPYLVHADQGQWYLTGFCHLAGAERLFRVDRIALARLLDQVFDPPVEPPDPVIFHVRPDDPRVVLDLDHDAAWVIDQYVVDEVSAAPGGRLRVRLAVSAPAWLERLLVRLGPAVAVVEADPNLVGVTAAAAAERVLKRYRR